MFGSGYWPSLYQNSIINKNYINVPSTCGNFLKLIWSSAETSWSAWPIEINVSGVIDSSRTLINLCYYHYYCGCLIIPSSNQLLRRSQYVYVRIKHLKEEATKKTSDATYPGTISNCDFIVANFLCSFSFLRCNIYELFCMK